MNRNLANLGLLLAAAIWGGGFVAQSSAMSHLGSGWITSLRFVLAFLAVAPLGLIEARRSRASRLDAGAIAILLSMGIAFFTASLVQQIAMGSTSVTNVGFLTGLYVLFVPCLEFVFFRRLPHPLIWLGALLALGGVGLLGGGFSALGSGDLLTVAAALGFALQIITMELFVRRTGRPVLAALFQSVCCIIGGGLWGLAFEANPVPALGQVWIELIYAGVFSGGIAFLLQAVCQRYTDAAEAAVLLMSESLFAALLAILLLGERLAPLGWLGVGLLMGGLVLAQLGPMIALRRARGH